MNKKEPTLMDMSRALFYIERLSNELQLRLAVERLSPSVSEEVLLEMAREFKTEMERKVGVK
jgi:hypothetical protein